MIIGKGRLGVLIKLFKLIQKNLPIPLIDHVTSLSNGL